MIRVSAGSAASMGLTSNKMDAYPTTAYFLSGSSCLMKCAFCPQGVSNNEALNRLGRVTWPEYSWQEVENHLAEGEKNGIKRICLQSVRHKDGISSLLKLVSRFKKISNLPISLSAWIKDSSEAAALVKAGVERLSISLDAVNPQVYQEIKGGSLQNRLDLLLECAARLPGKLSTHIICGLGESEFEALSIIDKLVKAGVTTALFAFVPLKGTPMEDRDPPPVDSYRRIQAGHYLMSCGRADFSSFRFIDGRLVSFGLSNRDIETYFSDGRAFQTSGCPHCNRPFYNERPGGIIYNYHRNLSESERKKALNELNQSLQEKL